MSHQNLAAGNCLFRRDHGYHGREGKRATATESHKMAALLQLIG